ncbi:N-acetylneuraminate synthase [Bacillus sp. RG28]|uniref:N-acetylneuraminate synthase n=1 Tax=Gottfriedia endophytica TaxID=2820819 RepID=A0A940NXB5_9BACI|nr:N-acetylneuraminate synthase [Gottfriedia endophytica]MBP0726733.1 N-acetylneuraminate synthase [Gottfriedia endophytica]
MTRTYVIAEAGVNHNGSLELAKKLIEVARDAGADAVKFQTFITENEISMYAPKAEYQLENTDDNESQFEMVKKLEFNKSQFEELIHHCKNCGIEFMSSPFDLESLDLLVNEFNLKTIKIPSGEITNPLLLLNTAIANCNIILSTGMSTLSEIETALAILAFGYIEKRIPATIQECFDTYFQPTSLELLKEKVALLHCNTEYPTPYEDVNLNSIETIRNTFGLEVGYSDHTEGIVISQAAVAMGATIIEKHITLDKDLPGPDHKASLNPKELNELIKGIRIIEKSIGNGRKVPTSSEYKNIQIARKSLVAATEINKGDLLSWDNVTFKRPGTGISPMEIFKILGKRSNRAYEYDEVIKDI